MLCTNYILYTRKWWYQIEKEKIKERFFFASRKWSPWEGHFSRGLPCAEKSHFSGFGLDKLIMHRKKQEEKDGILAKQILSKVFLAENNIFLKIQDNFINLALRMRGQQYVNVNSHCAHCDYCEMTLDSGSLLSRKCLFLSHSDSI